MKTKNIIKTEGINNPIYVFVNDTEETSIFLNNRLLDYDWQFRQMQMDYIVYLYTYQNWHLTRDLEIHCFDRIQEMIYECKETLYKRVKALFTDMYRIGYHGTAKQAYKLMLEIEFWLENLETL